MRRTLRSVSYTHLLRLRALGREVQPKPSSPLGRALGRALVRILHVESLNLRLVAGVRGDAAQTALLSGALLSSGKTAFALSLIHI